jgi:outer membrane receptor for monomeric catechols
VWLTAQITHLDGSCNTLGVCHQLSSGFELKHDKLSDDEGVKVKSMLMEPLSCVSHPSLSGLVTGKVSRGLESKSHMK